jgi:hypothetical protein
MGYQHRLSQSATLIMESDLGATFFRLSHSISHFQKKKKIQLGIDISGIS